MKIGAGWVWSTMVMGMAGVPLGCGTSPPPPAREEVAARTAVAGAEEPGSHAHGDAPLTLAQIAEDAAILPDLGTHERPVTTESTEAQAYFDQGLRLTYGFNHDEAARSYAKAAAIDPSCAACFWGVALVLGPNYNVPMLANRFGAAWEALERAQRAAPQATPVERALIDALARRYPGPEPVEPAAMAPYNQAYADAMAQVARDYPDDDDVQVMYAEALMDLRPWALWDADGTAAPGTQEIVATLETVLARNPEHPGANHYYIHAVEASKQPGRATAAADRLAALMPGAGHIVHMPAHIYQRTGRYADASQANRDAVAADERYIGRAPAWSYYGMYFAHNHGFLAYSASMEGRSEESLSAARAAAESFPPEMLSMMPGMDFFISEPLLVMVRFRRYDDILAEARPDGRYQTLTGLWLHAHGMALAATGELDGAASDLAELQALRDAIPEDLVAAQNSARAIVALGAAVLEATIAQLRDDPKHHELWAEAVAQNDRMAYNEPADWFYPVRHFQGAALLEAKQYATAELVYREDLRQNPENGWALYGLHRALAAQKKPEAARARARFERAWKNADHELTTTGLR